MPPGPVTGRDGMPTIAQLEPGQVVGGVDTHKHTHVAAVANHLGKVLDTEAFPATRAGYRRLLTWLKAHGDVVAVGVEGCGSWGAGLARHLTSEAVVVLEVNRPNRQNRRRRGKSDPVDAEAAARAVLSGEANVTPKAGDGPVEALRQLRVARTGAMKARTAAANQFHSPGSRPGDAGQGALARLRTAGAAAPGAGPARGGDEPRPRLCHADPAGEGRPGDLRTVARVDRPPRPQGVRPDPGGPAAGRRVAGRGVLAQARPGGVP